MDAFAMSGRSEGLATEGTVKSVAYGGGMTSIGLANDAGGDGYLPPGTYRVKIVRQWDDYEIGGRAEGVLLDDADVELAREAAKTEGTWTPREDTGDPLLDAMLNARMLRPDRHRRIYFALRDFKEEDR